MGVRLRSWWQNIKKHPYITGLVVLLVLILFIISAYLFGWDWTGFSGGESKVTTTMITPETTVAIEQQSAKTFWDWLGLLAVLAIPLLLGIATLLFGIQQAHLADLQHQSDQKLAQQQHEADQQSILDQQRQATLVTYQDDMRDLLLNRGLLTSKPTDEIRVFARTETLSAMRQLDGNRNRFLVQFLQDAHLIGLDSGNIVNFENADLSSTNLSGANLSGANLHYAYLNGADLRSARYLTQQQLDQVSSCKNAILSPGLTCHHNL